MSWKEVSEEEFGLYFFLGGKGFAWKWKCDRYNCMHQLEGDVPTTEDLEVLKENEATLFIPNEDDGETN